MSYLYFSWHVLAVASIIIGVNVIIQLQAGTQVKKHMVAKHTPVDEVPYTHNDVHSCLTVLEQKTTYLQDKFLGKGIDNLTIDKIVETKAAASDSELNSSFESLPTQVLSINSDICEIMSPLEEFNTLHRHCEGGRRDIKVKESSIV